MSEHLSIGNKNNIRAVMSKLLAEEQSCKSLRYGLSALYAQMNQQNQTAEPMTDAQVAARTAAMDMHQILEARTEVDTAYAATDEIPNQDELGS